MVLRISFLLRSVRPALVCCGIASAAVLGSVGVATADTPEYWSREAFHTARAADATVDVSEASPRYRSASTRGRSGRQSGRYVGGSRSRLGGPIEGTVVHERPRKPRGVRVASLGDTYIPESKPRRSLSGSGGIRWIASASCLAGSLRGVIAEVASRFGSVTVNSTCRSRGHNARVGGAPRSLHLTGDAADFRVHGNVGAVAAFLRSRVSGYKHYGGGLFHIDTGGRRPM
jgi:hypothetical protein